MLFTTQFEATHLIFKKNSWFCCSVCALVNFIGLGILLNIFCFFFGGGGGYWKCNLMYDIIKRYFHKPPAPETPNILHQLEFSIKTNKNKFVQKADKSKKQLLVFRFLSGSCHLDKASTVKFVLNVKYLFSVSFLTAAEFYNLGHIQVGLHASRCTFKVL